ncbi:MAG: 6-phosphogluconolactonase [Bacteroidetes bacterium]|nr:6-phosphogluconolactonase [Bacteroidota bacterium]
MVAYFIQSQIIAILQNQRQCNVVLTGGRSAARLYEAWGELAEFRQLNKVYFYFGDERCVGADHPESNYGLAMRTLFKLGVPPDCKVVRMAAEQADREAAAAAYEAQLPDRLDLLILSVGDDGHIASIFPHSAILQETKRRVVPVIAPKPPRDRLTVTPLVITQADRIFVMAIGPTKAEVYRKTLVEPQDIETLPARLALNATWFLDTDLNN